MPKIHNEDRKAELALARGGTVTDWAKAHKVPERTASTWACSSQVLDEVAAMRRAVTEQRLRTPQRERHHRGQRDRPREDVQAVSPTARRMVQSLQPALSAPRGRENLP
jgi:hypothetical protein